MSRISFKPNAFDGGTGLALVSLLPVHLDFQVEALSPLLYFIPLSLAANKCGTKVIQLVVQCGPLIHKIVFYLASAGYLL